MSFKEFLINYFSPAFLILRCCLFFLGIWSYFVSLIACVSLGLDSQTAHYISLIIALFIIYKSLKPWGVGMTVGEAITKYKKFINK